MTIDKEPGCELAQDLAQETTVESIHADVKEVGADTREKATKVVRANIYAGAAAGATQAREGLANTPQLEEIDIIAESNPDLAVKILNKQIDANNAHNTQIEAKINKLNEEKNNITTIQDGKDRKGVNTEALANVNKEIEALEAQKIDNTPCYAKLEEIQGPAETDEEAEVEVK